MESMEFSLTPAGPFVRLRPLASISEWGQLLSITHSYLLSLAKAILLVQRLLLARIRHASTKPVAGMEGASFAHRHQTVRSLPFLTTMHNPSEDEGGDLRMGLERGVRGRDMDGV